MKHINVTLIKNGEYWTASWYEPSGRRRRRSLGRICENNLNGMPRQRALVECAKIEAELNSSSPWRQRANPTVKYICEDWLANRRGNISDSTYKNYENAVLPLLMKRIGADTKANMVTSEDALSYRAYLQRAYKTNTAARHFRAAKSVFTRAMRQHFIQVNPFDLVDAPPDNIKIEYEYVPMDVFASLLKHEPRQDWRVYWSLLRYAGMRANEPLRLTWRHVDFDRLRLFVPGNKDGRITTKKKPREIPMVAELQPILLAWQNAAKPGDAVLPDVTRSMVNRRFKDLLSKANCTLEITPQALRVSRENDWMQVFPSPEVAAWMGHTVQTQIRNYHDPRSRASQRTMDDAVKPVDTIADTKSYAPSEKVSES